MHRRFGAFVGAALLLVASSCGGDDDATSDQATSPESDASADSGGSGEASGSSASDGGLPEEVGSADESLEPIVVGWMNTDDDTLAFPSTTEGFTTAIDYINSELGGIDGHPIEASVCSTQLDDASIQRCAQEFANDDAVGVVVQGYVLSDGSPHVPIFESAGMPLAVLTALFPEPVEYEDGVSFYAGGPGVATALPAFMASQEGATDIAVISSDNPSGRNFIDYINEHKDVAPYMADVNIEQVIVADDEVDYTGPLSSAGIEDFDAIVSLQAPAGCIQLADALVTMGIDTPVAAANSCTSGNVIEESGEALDGWNIVYGGPPPLVEDDPEVALFLEVMDEAGLGDIVGDTNTIHGFGMAMTLREVALSAGDGPLDREGWAEAMTSFSGPVFLGPDSMSCPGDLFPGLCTTEVEVYQLRGGELVDLTDGEGFDPFAF